MTPKEQVKNLDLKNNEQIDLESIHPKKLQMLIETGYVVLIDPEDGEKPFYMLTKEGKEIFNA